MPGIKYEDDRLTIDGTPAHEIAQAVGTPVYVYSAETIRARLAQLRRGMAELEPQIRYAVKANANATLLALLRDEGVGFDLVSGGELRKVLRAGADVSRCVFPGVGKQDWEIREALREGIGAVHVESESEFERVAWCADAEGVGARVALRLNPDVHVDTHAFITTATQDNKFGVDLGTAERLVGRIADDAKLTLVGYHVHLGSLLFEAEPYLTACKRVLEFIDGDAARSDGVTYYDCGGGYGSSGPFSDELFDFASLCEGLADLLPPRDLSLVCEPGRFLLGDAGVLLSEVVHVKEVATKRFVVVDAGMNDLIRPSLYRAEHEIRPVVSSGPALPVPTDVVGPICESTDFLGKGRELPAIERGELLAIFSAGAYGASMASNYNARPLPAEVLCGDGAPRCIRRRQTIEDLWRDEVDEPLGSAL